MDATPQGAPTEGAPPGAWVVIHGLADARRALAVAREIGRPVTLTSAPGAAGQTGPGWFKALLGELAVSCPGARFEAVLDCGDEAGTALAAMRAGIPLLRFTGQPAVAEKLAQIAAALGGRLVAAVPDRPALDLAGRWDPGTERRLRHHLGADGGDVQRSAIGTLHSAPLASIKAPKIKPGRPI